ncbi:hypothetical protein [Phyllobacterium sp. K27]
MPENILGKATRYASNGEIYYCIASILKFAPFIRNVWIVTDNQRPQFIDEFANAGLCPQDFIKIVDHKALFEGFESVLPTFNARTIETMLWRIPELSEHYIYFNDDFFLNKPLTPEFFFRRGLPVIFGKRALPHRWQPKTILRKALAGKKVPSPTLRPTYRAAHELGARSAGVKGRFVLVDHLPHPLRKSVQASFYHNEPELLSKQLKFRSRNIEQFSSVALINHLEISAGNAHIEKPVKIAYVTPHGRFVIHRFGQQVHAEQRPFGCIQSLDSFSTIGQGLIRSIMRKKFGRFLPETVIFEE